jgi:hypothetical protein
VVQIPREVDVKVGDETVKAYLQQGLEFAMSSCTDKVKELKEYALQQARNISWKVNVKLTYYAGTQSSGRIEAEGSYSFDVDKNLKSKTSFDNYVNYASHRWLPHPNDQKVIDVAEGRSGRHAEYRIRSDDPYYCQRERPIFDVIVEVPPAINLSDSRLAGAYIASGLQFAARQCNKLSFDYGSYNQEQKYFYTTWVVAVHLYQDGRELMRTTWERTGGSFTIGDVSIKEHRDLMAEERQAREKAEIAKREAERKETARRAVQEKLSAFMQKYGAERLVACESLATNPYALESKVVALAGIFRMMVARDKAVFEESPFGCSFALSGVPQGAFGTASQNVLVAARVLGHTEVKVGTRTVQVPHLKLLGIYRCEKQGCQDILPRD